MSLTSDELVDKSIAQREKKRFEEALVSSLAAIEADRTNPDAWWQTALNRRSLGDEKNALLALRKTVELAPRFSNGWSRLGSVLADAGETEEAKEAFETALRFRSENLEALEALSSIYSDEADSDQDEKEMSVLARIEEHSYLTSNQNNRLGNLHLSAKNFFEAIKYYEAAMEDATHPACFFNIGLVYNHPEVSQDADAVDWWRITKERWPDYEPPDKRLVNVVPRLTKLAALARAEGPTLLPKDQWYSFYMNPFGLLSPSDDLDDDDLDPKTIQRLKKTLLQEIELEDGAVSWMPGVIVDKSKAISLCDELNDETKRYYHWQVFSYKPLLHFLEKGAHKHFLVDDEESPLEIIQSLEDDDFKEWLSEPFVQQFDVVLGKAIEQRNLVILECLLDGRRWVTRQHADRCFENTRRQVDRLIEPLREANNKADNVLPSVLSLKRMINDTSLAGILNLLPTYFRDYQNSAAEQLRGIAISCNNSHGNADLSKEVLHLTKLFNFKSAILNQRLEEDFKKIEELIQEERKDEAKKTMSGQSWEITKEGVTQDQRFIAAADVAAVRWGVLVTTTSVGKDYDFLFYVTAENGSRISFCWKVSRNHEENHKHFGDLIDAAHSYIFPHLYKKLDRRLSSGNAIQLGGCKLTSRGIEFQTKGWVFSDDHFIPWDRVRISTENGEVIVQDAHSSKAKIALPLRETDNAPVLRYMAYMKSKN